MSEATLKPKVAALLVAIIDTSRRSIPSTNNLEMFEDEEDIREGLKALADEEDTCTFEEYLRRRKLREQ